MKLHSTGLSHRQGVRGWGNCRGQQWGEVTSEALVWWGRRVRSDLVPINGTQGTASSVSILSGRAPALPS